MPVNEHGAEEIEQGLRDLAARFPPKTKVALIGGCALTVRGIKPSTKDVDLVLVAAPGPEPIVQAFTDAGYAIADGYYLPGAPLDPHTMFDRPDGLWIDLFLRHDLFGGLSYSTQMETRSGDWFQTERAHITVADPSTVYLLKAVTGRWRDDPTRDIEDMQSLLDRGLVDRSFLDQEWQRQVSHVKDPVALRALAEESAGILAVRGYARVWRPTPH